MFDLRFDRLAAVHPDHVAPLVVDRERHTVPEVLPALGVEDPDRFQVVEQVAFRRQGVPDRLVRVADAERFQQRRLVEAASLQVRPAFGNFEERLVVKLGRFVQELLLLGCSRRPFGFDRNNRPHESAG